MATLGLSHGLYSAKGLQPSGAFLLIYVAILTSVGRWLALDSRRRGFHWAWDMGFFLYLAWPLIMLYYLFKTRGFAKTLLIVLAFVGAYLAGIITGRLIP